MKFALFFTITLLLFSCLDGIYSEKELSEFKVTQNALPDAATIQVIYCSGTPNFDGTAYLQYLVIDSASQDTFRVLSPELYQETDGSVASINTYFSADSKSKLGKIVTKELNKKRRTISKVISNNQYSDVENRNYPTVIGALGQSNVPKGELDEFMEGIE